MIRVEVKKKPNETVASLIRTFTKRVQAAGVLRDARAHRYHERTKSEQVKRKLTLRHLAKVAKITRLKKLGKIEDAPYKKFRS